MKHMLWFLQEAWGVKKNYYEIKKIRATTEYEITVSNGYSSGNLREGKYIMKRQVEAY